MGAIGILNAPEPLRNVVRMITRVEIHVSGIAMEDPTLRYVKELRPPVEILVLATVTTSLVVSLMHGAKEVLGSVMIIMESQVVVLHTDVHGIRKLGHAADLQTLV